MSEVNTMTLEEASRLIDVGQAPEDVMRADAWARARARKVLGVDDAAVEHEAGGAR